MPKAGGLDDVVQKFIGDNASYVKAADENVIWALKMAEANDKAVRSFKDVEDSLLKTAIAVSQSGAGFASLVRASSDIDSIRDSVKSYTAVVQEGIQAENAFWDANQRAMKQNKDIADVALGSIRLQQQAQREFSNDVIKMAGDIKQAQIVSISATKAAHIAANTERINAERALQAEIENTGRIADRANQAALAAITAATSRQRSVSGGILPAALATLAATGGPGSADTVAAITAVTDAAASMRRNAGGSFSRGTEDVLMSRLIAGMNQGIPPAAAPENIADILAGAVASRLFRGGGGGAAGGLSGATLGMIAADDASRRYSSIIPALLAGGAIAAVTSAVFATPLGATVRNAAGGAVRGAAVLAAYGGGAALNALAGGAGAISGGGSFLPGRSGQTANVVMPFLATWLPRIHYAMMATNEILATAGPAVIAGLAAGAVGLEGGQTAYGRLSAINNVGQSLGPALGQTPGQFLGLGNALQNAQTMADPAVWEIMGGALNDVNAATNKASGGLGNFWQLGTNTIDMIDRFGAKVTTAFQGGAGNQINALVSQGTSDLQQFGQVLGNVGKTFLNVAPALPGVGGDLLTTLNGATKGLAAVTGAIPASGLGMILAAEAGGRYGPALVGGLGNILGRAPGNILGTSARAAVAADVGAVVNPATGALVANEGEMIAGTGVAGALGGIGALPIAAAAALAYGAGKIITAQSPAQQYVTGLQSKVNQDNLTQAFGDLASNIVAFGNMASGPGPTGLNANQGFMQGLVEQMHGDIIPGARDEWQSFLSAFIKTPNVRTAKGTGNVALQNAAQQFNDLLSAGPAIQGLLGGGSLQNAYNIADMSGLQASQLSQLIHGTAKQKQDIRNQLLNEQRGFSVMAASPGAYGMNVNAVQAMGGLAGTKLSTVNQAWDQILSNATGGTAAATGFAGGVQALGSLALPAAQGPSGKDVRSIAEALGVSSSTARTLAASGGTAESFKAIAKALTGFTSPASQAAWSAFSSPSTTTPGALQQAQSMADWMRTAMTVSGGGIGQGQYNEVTAFQARQLLPYAKSSPAALAQLGVLSQEMGGPAYDATKSQAENYKNISKAIDGAAGSAKQYNKNVNDATIATAGVSQQALNFGATMKQNVYSALSGGATGLPGVSKDMENFKSLASKMASTGPGGGAINASGFKSAASSIATDLAGVNASAADTHAILSQALSGRGLNAAQINAAIGQVTSDMGKLQAAAGKGVNLKVSTSGVAQINNIQQALAAVKDKNVHAVVLGDTAGARQAAAAIAALHDKTVYVHVIQDTVIISRAMTAATNPYPGGISGRMQTGGMVPGFGSGDHVPALLEPGEAVVPRYLVPLIAPILKSHHVPGFASGGIVPAGTLAGVNSQISSEWKILDALYAQKDAGKNVKAQIAAFWKDVLDPLYKAKDAFTSMSKSATATAKAASTTLTAAQKAGLAAVAAAHTLATSITSKFSNELNYARGVSAAFSSGQGFGNAGLITGMDPTQKPVAQQMQDYLTSEQGFSKDLGTLSKGGLNKHLYQQLLAAGPVQGDLLAQSILQGGGTSGPNAGIGQVNKLWQQIGVQSHALGAQSAMAIFGGHIDPSLKGGSITSNNVNIHVSVPGGAQANISLTTAQINMIVAAVQAALLKQAKRNRQTGIKLPIKSA